MSTAGGGDRTAAPAPPPVGIGMLRGERVSLRPLEEADLPILYRKLLAVENRGTYYPASIMSMSELTRRHRRDGFWTDQRGLMLVVAADGSLVGSVEFFRSHPVTDVLELSYIIFDAEWRNKGVGTEDRPTVDMGAYEYACRGNIDRIASVTSSDIVALALAWGWEDCGLCDFADVTGDGRVDGLDLSLVCEHWLCGTSP